jgi:ribonuclease-3
MELTALEERLGYRFSSPALLEQAVTHRSHGAVHNERLEFLGDAVLNCTIAQLLYQRYARLNEGDLSRLRANLVKQSSLADIAERIDLSDFLRLGEGEMKSGGFRRPSILADTMEAIFGAVLVDGGFEAGSGVITRLFEPVLKHVDPKTLGKDSKTLLQEYLQGKRLPLPVYTVVETRGAAHNQEFEVECAIPKLDISVRGNGRSRRAAEQTAAKLALDQAQAALSAARRAKRKPAAGPEPEPHDTAAVETRPAPTPSATASADGERKAAHGGGTEVAPAPVEVPTDAAAGPAPSKPAARATADHDAEAASTDRTAAIGGPS